MLDVACEHAVLQEAQRAPPCLEHGIAAGPGLGLARTGTAEARETIASLLSTCAVFTLLATATGVSRTNWQSRRPAAGTSLTRGATRRSSYPRPSRASKPGRARRKCRRRPVRVVPDVPGRVVRQEVAPHGRNRAVRLDLLRRDPDRTIRPDCWRVPDEALERGEPLAQHRVAIRCERGNGDAVRKGPVANLFAATDPHGRSPCDALRLARSIR